MTAAERQALREKHGKFGFRDNRTFCVFCLDDDGLDIPYPCDVIKVLDATEPVSDNKVSVSGLNDNLLSVHCDHRIETLKGKKKNAKAWFGFPYCPKCGVEL